jgi:hypothetical protein
MPETARRVEKKTTKSNARDLALSSSGPEHGLRDGNLQELFKDAPRCFTSSTLVVFYYRLLITLFDFPLLQSEHAATKFPKESSPPSA